MSISISDGPFVTFAGIQGAPFQAQYERIDLEKLPDGKTLQQIKTGVIYRDTYGRSRREINTKTSSEVSSSESTIIHDPIKQEAYFLETESKTFSTVSMPDVPVVGAEPSSNILENLSERGEYIGRQLIEGLNCYGYRVNQSGDGVIEYWVAKEIQDVLLGKYTNSYKTITMRLFDVRIIEPDSRMFTVSPEYKDISDANQG
ncbi:MAG: DUF4412 domain-containing protein [Pyrinomonadaceae bacterium]